MAEPNPRLSAICRAMHPDATTTRVHVPIPTAELDPQYRTMYRCDVDGVLSSGNGDD